MLLHWALGTEPGVCDCSRVTEMPQEPHPGREPHAPPLSHLLPRDPTQLPELLHRFKLGCSDPQGRKSRRRQAGTQVADLIPHSHWNHCFIGGWNR